MKYLTQIKTIIFVAIITIVVSACTVNNNTTPTDTFPDLSTIIAKSNYDTSYMGIYKGIIGDSNSTGNILIDFNNSQSEAKGYLRFKGNQYILTQSDIATVGNLVIVTIQNSDVVVKLSVTLKGVGPYISYIKIGNSESFGNFIAKETTTNKIKCFEGTYNSGVSSSSSCGTFVNIPLGVFISGQSAFVLVYVNGYNGVGSGYYFYIANYDVNTQKISLTIIDQRLNGTIYKLYGSLNGNVINNNMNGVYDLYIGTSIYNPVCFSKGDWSAIKTL